MRDIQVEKLGEAWPPRLYVERVWKLQRMQIEEKMGARVTRYISDKVWEPIDFKIRGRLWDLSMNP